MATAEFPMRLRTHLSTRGVERSLRRIIDFIAQTSKYLALEVRKAQGSLTGTQNLYGEEQLALDVLADQVLETFLARETSFGVREFVSEERDAIRHLETRGGRYSVAVDPLDGSSLVDVNLSVGTIVGIHDGQILSGEAASEQLVAALYVLYGPRTTLVYSAGDGTHEFRLDDAGNFVLLTESIRMEERGRLYSPGGLKRSWLADHRAYIEELERRRYTLRYSGGFVPDLNHLLGKRGGLFTYPALKEAPAGKLRLLFELQPMAFLMEQAGGVATDGRQRILDIVPDSLDQRSPIYIGSRDEVKLAAEFLDGSGSGIDSDG
jgi:fructose-1,6-bisphosphatase I